MLLSSIGVINSSYGPDIPTGQLVNWYEPGNSAGIINNGGTLELANLAPGGDSGQRYVSAGTPQFSQNFIGATTISITDINTYSSWTTNNSFVPFAWDTFANYTLIIISKYNDANGQCFDTFVDPNGATFKLGNCNGANDVCIINGQIISAGNQPDSIWAMYTIIGQQSGNSFLFYKNNTILASSTYKQLPQNTVIFDWNPPPTESSVGAILCYGRAITNKERISIFEHYKQRFGMQDA